MNHKLTTITFAAISTLPTFAALQQGNKNLGAIAFFGDSITESSYDGDGAGSPRKSLYDRLIANGYSFTYTGSSTSYSDGFNTSTQSSYIYHNGYSAAVISNSFDGRIDMTNSLNSHWTSGRLATVKPNVIISTLGTNDVSGMEITGQTVQQITNNYRNYLNNIFTLSDNAGTTPTLFVSTIAPNYMDPTRQSNTDAFNTSLLSIVNALKAQGRDAYLLDLNTPLKAGHNGTFSPNGPGDMSDVLHPNKIGNGIMADQWFQQINALTVPEPSTITLSAAATITLLTRRRRP